MARAKPVLDPQALALVNDVYKRLVDEEERIFATHQTTSRAYHGRTDEGAAAAHQNILKSYKLFLELLLDENKKRSR